ncbi:RHS repeat-associated core domain-containing protein [Cellulomonas xiejunii]|uniref:RHS repeat-associated core domain-containing protein n=1 Tax=Cellulomonas xiejunii TaxID=2968083 RepID=UPI003FD76673
MTSRPSRTLPGAPRGCSSTPPVGGWGQHTARCVSHHRAGLTFHRARYYDAGLGRFISEDPIGFAGRSNLYAYGANAPTVFTDPTGHNPMLIGCVAGAAFDGGAAYIVERLSGRKVNWGTVGGAAALGCALGALGGWAFKGAAGAARTSGSTDTVTVFRVEGPGNGRIGLMVEEACLSTVTRCGSSTLATSFAQRNFSPNG